MNNTEMRGTVIWWNRQKGYGIADAEDKQILLHHTQITNGHERGEEKPYLRGGDSIGFGTHDVNPNIAKNIVLNPTPPSSPNQQEMTPPRTTTRQTNTNVEEDTDEEY